MSKAGVEVGRPRIFGTLLKAFFYGSPIAAMVFVLIKEGWQDELIGLGVIVVIFGLVFTRAVHGLFIGPYLRLSPDGIALRYWDPRPRLFWLRPMRSVVEAFVPWDEYESCTTYSHTANGIPTLKALIIKAADREYFIGWDVFRGSVSKLQTEILDYIQAEFYQEERDSYHVADFCRQRFQTPVRIRPAGPFWVLVSLGVTITYSAIVYYMYQSGIKFPEFFLGVPILGVMFVFWAFVDWFGTLRGRFLEIDSNGFRLGFSSGLARRTRWEDIAFVRPVTKSETFNSMGGGTETSALSVRLRGGSTRTVRNGYKNNLNIVYELIDPPLDTIADARARMEAGLDVETAAIEAGLPPLANFE